MKKLIFSLLFFSNICFANNLVFQHAGELGRIAIGYGFNFGEVYNLELIYGYHPKLNTYAIRNNFKVFNYERINLNLGLTLYQADNFYNNNVPDNYYEQSTHRRAYLFYSIEYLINDSSIYFENGINDVGLEAVYNNDNLELKDFASIGFGLRSFF